MILLNCDELKQIEGRAYGGATGSKICVAYNGYAWMLKRGQILRDKNMKNVELSFANDPISEYIGSHIYGIIGIPVHDTLLGIYKGRMCVLCKDLAYPENIIEFRSIRNMIMDDSIVQHSSGMSRSLNDILEVINVSSKVNKEDTLSRFWLMFIVDALIGNTDRNNGNWGYLYYNNTYNLCPVYDCGGCLNNKRSIRQMLDDFASCNIKNMALNYTFNFIDERNKRVNPFHYFKKYGKNNIYIKYAMNFITPDLLPKIYEIIDSLDGVLEPTRNIWYKEVLRIRLEKLLELKEKLQ